MPLQLGITGLFGTAIAGKLLDGTLDHFMGFPGEFLNPAHQFVLLAFGIPEVIIGELGPFLFQLAFGDVPVAFDFQCVHMNVLFVLLSA